jgi:hypothetical protein
MNMVLPNQLQLKQLNGKLTTRQGNARKINLTQVKLLHVLPDRHCGNGSCDRIHEICVEGDTIWSGLVHEGLGLGSSPKRNVGFRLGSSRINWPTDNQGGPEMSRDLREPTGSTLLTTRQ